MKRYTSSIRTGGRTREDRLRDQFTAQLAREGEKLLQNLSQHYMQDLQSQTAQLLQSMLSTSASPAAANSPLPTSTNLIGNVGQLLSTTVRYFVSKPRTSHNTVETNRSQEVDSRFRLSQSQAMAEAAASMSRGNKNL